MKNYIYAALFVTVSCSPIIWKEGRYITVDDVRYEIREAELERSGYWRSIERTHLPPDQVKFEGNWYSCEKRCEQTVRELLLRNSLAEAGKAVEDARDQTIWREGGEGGGGGGGYGGGY